MTILSGNRVMAALTIPQSDIPAYIAIVEFDKDSFAGLLKALQQTVPSINRGKFITELIAKVPNLNQNKLVVIVRALFALYDLKDAEGYSIDDLAAVVARATSEIPKVGDIFKGDKVSLLRERLVALLSLDESLGLVIKAIKLVQEYERYYCGSRILSDIRTVFADDPGSIKAAIVMHNLQIGFHDGATGEHKEFYVALDDFDLQDLREAIGRAEKKSAALKGLLKASKVNEIGI